ncbi:MAG: MerR family transcriptional regulator [Mycobacterium sp.]
MTQYRIGDLAEASGVNTRNIRAYRERGLLDPPRRDGRLAIYSDVHLEQLRVINQLLAKGFTSSHIADFFSAMRAGHDLADFLGLQDVFAGAAGGGGADTPTALPLDVDLTDGDARRMIATGLACAVGGQLMLVDPELVGIVSRAPDRRQYLATIVEVFASTRQGIAAAAEDVDSVIEEAAAELLDVAAPRERAVEPVRVLQDYRELAAIVISRQVDEAVRGQVMRSTA